MQKILIEKTRKLQITNGLSHREFRCKCSSNLCHYTLIDERLIAAWMNLRKEYGKPITITSGFRCQKHNEDVAGVPNSYHTTGAAIDIYKSEVDDFVLEELCMKHFDFVKVYKEFIHAHMVN